MRVRHFIVIDNESMWFVVLKIDITLFIVCVISKLYLNVHND